MTGGQQPVPVQSFLEPPTARPFDNPVVGNVNNPTEFVAETGGVRELRRKQRQERRADRKADRKAIRELKRSSRKTRRAKPFKDGAGPIVEMTRAEKRADRKATRKASRIFRKQERKARRLDRKEDRIERRTLRKKIKSDKKQNVKDLTQDKLTTLNRSESSSKKVAEKQPFIGPKQDTSKKETVTKKKEEKKKETKPKGKSVDDMSFSEAYRAQRDANKKAGIPHYGDDRGYFTWRGKEYNTESKEERAKRKKLATKPTEEKKKEIKSEDLLIKDDKKKEEKKKDDSKKKKKKTDDSSSSSNRIYPPSSCFSEGTLIETSNGRIPIEMIQLNDEVKSYNTKTKEIELAKVDELFVHEDCGDGLILNDSIKTTTNHPFYVDGEWVDAGDLKIGDKILHVDGSEHEITSMEINTDKQTVYNFEVPGNHNYFAEGYLVHNKQRRGGYRRRGGIR